MFRKYYTLFSCIFPQRYIFNKLKTFFHCIVTHICLHSVLFWRLHYGWKLKGMEARQLENIFQAIASGFLAAITGQGKAAVAYLQIFLWVLLRDFRVCHVVVVVFPRNPEPQSRIQSQSDGTQRLHDLTSLLSFLTPDLLLFAQLTQLQPHWPLLFLKPSTHKHTLGLRTFTFSLPLPEVLTQIMTWFASSLLSGVYSNVSFFSFPHLLYISCIAPCRSSYSLNKF